VTTTTAFAEKNMEIIINDIRDMMGYDRRSKSIEEFLNCIMTKREYSNLIEANWRSYYNEKQQRSLAVFPA
jgi:folate-dependent tRNA-U54 methylase TrmFO/GidA